MLARADFTQVHGVDSITMNDHRRRKDAAHDPIHCPVNATLNLLNARWTLHIVRTLLEGKKRFNEIARANGINPRTLRERLRDLEAEGAVKRTVISTIPPNVEYELTEKGQALNCIIEALAEWGRTWMAPPAGETGEGGASPLPDCPEVTSE